MMDSCFECIFGTCIPRERPHYRELEANYIANDRNLQRIASTRANGTDSTELELLPFPPASNDRRNIVIRNEPARYTNPSPPRATVSVNNNVYSAIPVARPVTFSAPNYDSLNPIVALPAIPPRGVSNRPSPPSAVAVNNHVYSIPVVSRPLNFSAPLPNPVVTLPVVAPRPVSNRSPAQGNSPTTSLPDDFVSEVLSWKLDVISRTITTKSAVLKRLRQRYTTEMAYYSAFIPLILNETMAVIHEGIEKFSNNTANEFPLELMHKVNLPRSQRGYSYLNFAGKIISEDEDASFYAMNVLLLSNRSYKYLAIANDDREGLVKVRMFINALHYGSNSNDFEVDAKWSAIYLGSLVTLEREFNTCVNKNNGMNNWTQSIVSKIVRGNCGVEYNNEAISLDALQSIGMNSGQRTAIEHFRCMKKGFLMMLQGPPGTGKTTTISALLSQLYTNNQRTLVCAPSNKAIQVLANSFLKRNPDSVVLLIGSESKITDELLLRIFESKIIKSTLENVNNIQKIRDSLYSDREIPLTRNKIKEIAVKIDKCIQDINKTLKRYSIIPADLFLDNSNKLIQFRLLLNTESMNAYCYTLDPILNCLLDTGNQSAEDRLSKKLFQSSKIIFCTLCTSGNRKCSENMGEVEVLIVDEAGQTVEAETLIAFQHNPHKVLLVGDTKQLPATVISKQAEENNYNWSMMARLQVECEQQADMLTVQYRMHPEICKFPSFQYYNNRLETYPGVLAHRYSFSHFQSPYMVIDIANGNERTIGSSKANEVEAEYVKKIIGKIRYTDSQSSIGVITFYNAQRECIEKKIRNRNNLKISSVDGFQGDECDIIIVSCVRANRSNAVGFVRDERRLNVAITRARHFMVIVGSANVLRYGSQETRSLIQNAESRRLLFTENDLQTWLGNGSNSRRNRRRN